MSGIMCIQGVSSIMNCSFFNNTRILQGKNNFFMFNLENH
jgi:hypothetical protein